MIDSIPWYIAVPLSIIFLITFVVMTRHERRAHRRERAQKW